RASARPEPIARLEPRADRRSAARGRSALGAAARGRRAACRARPRGHARRRALRRPALVAYVRRLLADGVSGAWVGAAVQPRSSIDPLDKIAAGQPLLRDAR